jgi:hypothetical protein
MYEVKVTLTKMDGTVLDFVIVQGTFANRQLPKYPEHALAAEVVETIEATFNTREGVKGE